MEHRRQIGSIVATAIAQSSGRHPHEAPTLRRVRALPLLGVLLLALIACEQFSYFSVTLSTDRIEIAQGGSGSVEAVLETVQAGIGGPGDIVVRGLPEGVTYTHEGIINSARSVLTFTVASSAAVGSYDLEVETRFGSIGPARLTLSIVLDHA